MPVLIDDGQRTAHIAVRHTALGDDLQRQDIDPCLTVSIDMNMRRLVVRCIDDKAHSEFAQYRDHNITQGVRFFKNTGYGLIVPAGVPRYFRHIRTNRQDGKTFMTDLNDLRIFLDGHIDVPPERLEGVRAALPEHIRLTLAEPGCLSFQVSESGDVAGRFEVSEVFVDRAAFDAHQQRAKASAWFDVTAGIPRDYTIRVGSEA